MKSIWAGAAIAAAVMCAGAGSAEAEIIDFSFSGDLQYDADHIFVTGDAYLNTSTDQLVSTTTLTINGVRLGSTFDREAFSPFYSGVAGENGFEVPPYLFVTFTGSPTDPESIKIDNLYYNRSFFRFHNVSSSTTVVDTFSVVPLPSSAPLFGAALLALGGTTYARRQLAKGA